ncbi:MAG: hypothetical protein LBP52_02400 [Burkholderiaceae bacterium]|jgi:biotin carboxylase|nr:hypothetical protein [Burkholderiaceae bacterium]
MAIAILRELGQWRLINSSCRWPKLGYPLVVRPSYVLGGRAMEIVHEQRDWNATCLGRSVLAQSG